MPLLPVFGHGVLRTRLLESLEANVLPQSLLLHGPARVGKQRLALWLGQVLLCAGAEKPCGRCAHCRMVLDLNHKDLLWNFPQVRAKDGDITPEEAAEHVAAAAHERAEAFGLYPSPSGMEGIHIPAIRGAVRHAVMTPALARRKVIIVGDADRMASQEGSEQAANAFLKLLEEPPADTFVIITTSYPGKLLPTIRSRVVALRVAPVPDEIVSDWFAHITSALQAKERKHLDLPATAADAGRIASGAIGRLLDSHSRSTSLDMARRFIEVAQKADKQRAASLALSQGSAGARGAFTDTLDALVDALVERMRAAVRAGDEVTARAAAAAVDLVEEAKVRAYGNNNPQLIASGLLTEMTRLFARVA